MRTGISIILPLTLFLSLAACESHPTLRYKPHEYAQMRDIELVTTAPARPYQVLANIEASGGRHTTTTTMINSMIDKAGNAGADALIPLEFGGPGKSAKGLEQFVYTEDGRTITKGRAIRWERSAQP
jgi:hypothetical protein